MYGILDTRAGEWIKDRRGNPLVFGRYIQAMTLAAMLRRAGAVTYEVKRCQG
jgi:hypothetical protein